MKDFRENAKNAFPNLTKTKAVATITVRKAADTTDVDFISYYFTEATKSRKVYSCFPIKLQLQVILHTLPVIQFLK